LKKKLNSKIKLAAQTIQKTGPSLVDVEIVADDPKYIPQYKTDGSACADLVAQIKSTTVGGLQTGNSHTLNFRCSMRISTGCKMAIPEGYKLCFAVRSSFGDRGLVITNSPAQIDSDYRGYIEMSVLNVGRELVRIEDGDRIAQCWLEPVVKAGFKVVEKLNETARGEGGFGSTGVK
jgi:dUTP pyrophosphatase